MTKETGRLKDTHTQKHNGVLITTGKMPRVNMGKDDLTEKLMIRKSKSKHNKYL